MRSTVSLAVVLMLASAGPAIAQTEPTEVHKPGSLVTMPSIVKEVKPSYTADAIRARIEGSVRVECVVNVDGTVGDVRVTQPLDASLDAEAVRAVKQWQFRPGTKDGKPVRVQVEVELTFTLRNGPRLGSPEVYLQGSGVRMPTVLAEIKPNHPPDLKNAGVGGIVTLDCVVLPNGSVGDIKVTKPLHPVLDAEAVAALRKWRFQAGSLDGRPVPVQVTVEISFDLR